MMLELADQNLVAGFEKGGAPALRDEVDRLGGAADKDDLARVGGVQKARTLTAPPRIIRSSGCSADRPRDARWRSRCGNNRRCWSITSAGFWALAPESRNTSSGLLAKIGNSLPEPARFEPARQPISSGVTSPPGWPSSCLLLQQHQAAGEPRQQVLAHRAGSTVSTASRKNASISIRRAASRGMPRASR